MLLGVVSNIVLNLAELHFNIIVIQELLNISGSEIPLIQAIYSLKRGIRFKVLLLAENLPDDLQLLLLLPNG